MRSCREVMRLVLEAGDRRLTLRERAAVRVHLWMCAACPPFERQAHLMQEALGRWRRYRDDGGDGAGGGAT